jgi:ABC transport system ATP-binding/permease protein
MTALDEKETIRLPLDGSTATLGRDPSCTVALTGLGISRQHAAVELTPSASVIIDLGSTFGLRVNGTPVDRHALVNGDRISVGVREFIVDIRDNALLLSPLSEREDRYEGVAGGGADNQPVRIGRDPDSDLVLAHPLVSRCHASVQRRDDGAFQLIDFQSTNGTYVNGRPITRGTIVDGDIVQIGPYRLFVEQGRIVKADDSNRIRLEAFDVTVREKGSALVEHATLSVPPGEFVAVLGVSGAGKSTLVRALSGRQRIESGAVFINGLPLRQFCAGFAANIGYVAQDNLLHPELTVAETFAEQSLIRLPRDSTAAERKSRIDEVIALLELDRVIDRRINRLSGGEAKRVHLGVELLASPALIVLDEPLAGLDPGLVRKFMKLFRRVSDRGHTLLMTTHTLEQIDFCDRIVFMHRGKVIFAGPPSGLEAAFGTPTLADVYEKVAQGADIPFPQPLNTGRPPALPAQGGGSTVRRFPLRKPRIISFARQFAMLTVRYGTILRRDRKNLLLLLLQAPAIALFLGFVFRSGAPYLPLSFYFCVTISAVWISGINAAQEIAREWRLLDRDFRAGLSRSAYLAAKSTVAIVSALSQAALFWLSLGLIFKKFDLTPETLLLVAAGTVSGAILGLCISALSGGPGRAITVLPIIFIPQIFFSGILIPFDRMSAVGSALSYLTVSRPVFTLFKQACILDRPLAGSDAWTALCILDLGLIILMTVAVRWRTGRDAVA